MLSRKHKEPFEWTRVDEINIAVTSSGSKIREIKRERTVTLKLVTEIHLLRQPK